MNPFLKLIGAAVAGNSDNLLRKAVAAMMSGQEAEDFMQNLAQTDSRFQGLDFSNLEQTAHELCRKKGVDEKQLTQKIQNDVQNMM